MRDYHLVQLLKSGDVEEFNRIRPPVLDLRWSELNDLVLPGVNFSGADLRQTNLARTDLTGANLRGAILEEANLQGAILRRVNLCRAILRNANLSHSELREVYAREADFRGARLDGAKIEDDKFAA